MPERKRVLLRLDPAVYDGIARWAADDLRSVNAQIEYALRRALHAAGRLRAGPSDSDGDGTAPTGGTPTDGTPGDGAPEADGTREGGSGRP